MQLFKHMEVVLMLAFGIVCATFALHPAAGRASGDDAGPATVMRVDALAPMPVVHVVGRRLTPEEKHAG
jgi:hypothetical protein